MNINYVSSTMYVQFSNNIHYIVAISIPWIFIVKIAINTVHCTVYIIQSTIYSVHCTVYNLHCIPHNKYCIESIVLYIVYIYLRIV